MYGVPYTPVKKTGTGHTLNRTPAVAAGKGAVWDFQPVPIPVVNISHWAVFDVGHVAHVALLGRASRWVHTPVIGPCWACGARSGYWAVFDVGHVAHVALLGRASRWWRPLDIGRVPGECRRGWVGALCPLCAPRKRVRREGVVSLGRLRRRIKTYHLPASP
jgi:hypothetical protein